MGLIGKVIGGAEATKALGGAVEGVAEVFTPNATRRMENSAEMQRAAMEAMAAEFQYDRPGLFDRLITGLNRLPRPLFAFAMLDPVGFGQRMAGLTHVPEPLWWLLGAIVSFYFGARELHYFRTPGRRAEQHSRSVLERLRPRREPAPVAPPGTGSNSAISAWRAEND